MNVIKLSAIDSTNRYLKHHVAQNLVDDFTVVITENQTHGTGQRGTQWQSTPNKNLTFSVYKAFDNLSVKKQFYISIATSIAVYNTLLHYNVPQLAIKWPNDILSAKKKIAGILIENSIKQSYIKHSIIGIGLNVNTQHFSHLPQATSMILASHYNEPFDIDDVLQQLLTELRIYYKLLNTGSLILLKRVYESVLFNNNILSEFRRPDTSTFKALIKGVAENGQLITQTENGDIRRFNLKDIQLLY